MLKGAKTLIGYKVLWDHDGKLHSAAMSTLCGGLVYTPGIVAKPQRGCGPLAVFRSLETAKAFRIEYRFAKRVIWEVAYVPSKATKIWDMLKYITSLCQMPVGTELASKLVLLWPVEGGLNADDSD